MSLVAAVKDGKVVDTRVKTEADYKAEKTEKSGSNLDKDAFLQLLVAQMKYQDPLEPTSNTEYISQLATFSSLEEMQNMTSAMNLQRASGLVGQEVYIETTDPTTGVTNPVHGKVNYVSYQNGKAYVNVNGEDYALDDVESIYDPEYTKAYDLAYEWTVGLNKLPNLSKVTLSDKEDIMKLKETYDNMTDYQKTFLTDENQKKLESYVNQIELLTKAKEELDKKLEEANKEDEADEDGDDTAEGTDKTDGTTSGSDKTDTAASGTDKTDGTDNTQESVQTDTEAANAAGAAGAVQSGSADDNDTETVSQDKETESIE